MSSYTEMIRRGILPTRPFRNGRRCDGYQYWCFGDVIPPTPPEPIECTEEIVISQSFRYIYGPLDLGTVKYNAACPSINEQDLEPAESIIDLGVL